MLKDNQIDSSPVINKSLNKRQLKMNTIAYSCVPTCKRENGGRGGRGRIKYIWGKL